MGLIFPNYPIDLQMCIDMIDNPSEENFHRLMKSAEGKQGRPRLWERALEFL